MTSQVLSTTVLWISMLMIPWFTQQAWTPKCLGARMEKDLERVAAWIEMNGLKMDVTKTQLMVLSSKGKCHMADSVNVNINLKSRTTLEWCLTVTYLGKDTLSMCTNSAWASWLWSYSTRHLYCIAGNVRGTKLSQIGGEQEIREENFCGLFGATN